MFIGLILTGIGLLIESHIRIRRKRVVTKMQKWLEVAGNVVVVAFVVVCICIMVILIAECVYRIIGR